ncbi:MAG: tetratricopeptide repeat protein [Candidatus Xenobiia bacterium LiM19]
MSFVPLASMDTDTWWHMASGRCFVANGHIPSRNPMSFASDVPWLPCEWLCDVILYALMQAGGIDLLILFRSFLVAACAVLLFILVIAIMGRSRCSALVALIICMLTVMALRPFYLIRPHLIAYVLYILFLIPYFTILEDYRRDIFTGQMKNSILFISYTAFLTFVTVNCHPTFIFFPGFLLIWLVCHWFSVLLHWTSPRPAQSITVAVTLAVICLVSLLNPLGITVALHPFDYVVSHVYTKTIAEFLPPSFFTCNPPYFQIFLLLDIFVIFSLLKQKRLSCIIILLIFTRQALISTRYLSYLYIFIVPAFAVILSPYLPGMVKSLALKFNRLKYGLWLKFLSVAASIALLILSVFLMIQTGRQNYPLYRTMIRDTFPIDTVTFIRLNNLQGRLFNAFEWGGYLEWERPQLKVFIDAQNDSAFSESTYLDYMHIVRAGRLWKGLLDYYKVDMVLLRRTPPVLELNSALRKSSGWVCVYEDHNAELYMRRSSAADKLTENLKKVDENSGSAYYSYYLGNQRLQKGDRIGALKLFEGSIRKDPYYAPAYVSIGVILALQGNPEEARKMWEKALVIDHDVHMAHYNLGIFWKIRGDLDKAGKHFKREKHLNPQMEIPALSQ